jgi:transposase
LIFQPIYGILFIDIKGEISMNNLDELSKEQLIKLLQEKEKDIEQTNKIIELKDKDIEQANKIIELKNKKIELATKTIDKLTIELRDVRIELEKQIAKNANKEQRILRDTYNQFVRTSEKIEPTDEVINEAEEKSTKVRGRKEGTKNFSSSITPLKTIIIEPNEKVCKVCGEVLVPAGEDRTIKIVRKPATYEAIEIIYKKYKCTNCEIIYEHMNDDVYPHSPITPSVTSDIINMKYNLGVPLDRYSKYLISKGINLSTPDLSNYVLRTSEILTPLYDEMKKYLINNKAKVIHADETTLNVLDVKERQKSYMFVYTTSFYDQSVYIYDFSINRTTEKTQELLSGYTGYLVCDGYSGYDRFKPQLQGIQRCLAHVRRYYYDIVKTLKPEEAKRSKAKHVVDLLGKIFKEEAFYREKKYTIPEIRKKRNSKEYTLLINDLHDYVWSIEPMPGSLLAKAVNYTKNVWNELFTYRESGYIDCTNNLAERTVKPFVIGRKAFLFSKTINGAVASSILFSIVQTAKANGLVVERYLEYVISNIGKKNIDELLPWSKSLPKETKINFNNIK